jgi:hypothetical protein
MPGNTATISVHAFRADWMTHMPMRALCDRHSVTRDQVIRLRDLWNLPLRNDRRLRWKPKRSEIRDPTPREIEQACKEIQAQWDERTRELRHVIKPQAVTLKRIEMTDEAWEAFEGLDDGTP